MFGRKKRHEERHVGVVEVRMPAPGPVIALTDVPDPVFAGGLVGQGVAVDPTEGVFVAPVTGTLTLVADTGHAFGLRTDEGLEVLVHVGIDTVTLKGEGFTRLRNVGDRVTAGTPIVEVDLPVVAARVPSVISPVLVTNPDRFSVLGTTPSGALLVAPEGRP